MKWKPLFSPFLFISFLFSIFYFLNSNSGVSAVNIPTAVIASPAVTILTQSDYRWYANINSLTPATALNSEDASTSTPTSGVALRLRMNVGDTSLQLGAGAAFKLQYANSTSGSWTDLSTSTPWVFFDNPGVADGQIIVTTLLSGSNVGESYGESNPSATTPNAILPGQKGEWDWVIRNNSASTASNWFFRMVYSSGVVLDAYSNYPQLTAVPTPVPSPSPPQSSAPGGISGGGGGTGFHNISNITSTVPPPVSPLPVPPPLIPPRYQIADFNGDGRVDIIDLSILLYHYGETGPDASHYDLDHNGIVDFPDVSILMYYWTD